VSKRENYGTFKQTLPYNPMNSRTDMKSNWRRKRSV